MTIEITVLISAVSVAFAIYSGLKNGKRVDTKDIEERAAENARVNLKLDENIRLSTEVRDEIKKHGDRITRLESSIEVLNTKQEDLVRRLDHIEKGGV